MLIQSPEDCVLHQFLFTRQKHPKSGYCYYVNLAAEEDIHIDLSVAKWNKRFACCFPAWMSELLLILERQADWSVLVFEHCQLAT